DLITDFAGDVWSHIWRPARDGRLATAAIEHERGGDENDGATRHLRRPNQPEADSRASFPQSGASAESTVRRGRTYPARSVSVNGSLDFAGCPDKIAPLTSPSCRRPHGRQVPLRSQAFRILRLRPHQ